MTDELQQLEEDGKRAQITHYNAVAKYMELKAATELAVAECNLAKAQLEVKTTELMHLRMQNANRPSIVLQAQITEMPKHSRHAYVASYAGVTAEGDTPEIAFQNFDRFWSQGRERD